MPDSGKFAFLYKDRMEDLGNINQSRIVVGAWSPVRYVIASELVCAAVITPLMKIENSHDADDFFQFGVLGNFVKSVIEVTW